MLFRISAGENIKMNYYITVFFTYLHVKKNSDQIILHEYFQTSIDIDYNSMKKILRYICTYHNCYDHF